MGSSWSSGERAQSTTGKLAVQISARPNQFLKTSQMVGFSTSFLHLTVSRRPSGLSGPHEGKEERGEEGLLKKPL